MLKLELQPYLFPEAPNIVAGALDQIELTINPFLEKEQLHEVSKLDKKISLPEKNAQPLRISGAQKRAARDQRKDSLPQWHGFKRKLTSREDEEEFEVLQLRKYLDGKHQLKTPDMVNKEYFQVGTLVPDALEGKSRKASGSRLIDHFKQSDHKRGFTERTFATIQQERMKRSKNRKWRKLHRARILGSKNTLSV